MFEIGALGNSKSRKFNIDYSAQHENNYRKILVDYGNGAKNKIHFFGYILEILTLDT